MTKKPSVIIVQGQPCTGKTALVQKLSQRLGIPYLARDEFKELLFDKMGIEDREWSLKLGAASYDLLFLTFEKLLKSRVSFFLECNFTPELHSSRISALLAEHEYSAMDVFLEADASVLMNRFIHRWESGERHRGHVDNERIKDLSERLESTPLRPLGVGDLIQLNTNDFSMVDIEGLVTRISKDLRISARR